MKLLAILLFAAASTVCASAQTTFTRHLTRRVTGKASVILVHDSLIDRAINFPRATEPKKQPAKPQEKPKPAAPHDGQTHETPEQPAHNDPATTPHTRRTRYKAQGFRIQIFTGSNTGADKAKAQEMGARCQKLFPTLSVYARFISPRWICRVGDFKTHEEAEQYAAKIRAAHLSNEVRIVRCEVLLAH